MVLLCAAAILLTADHTRDDSITVDEPLHIFAGAEYLQHGTYFTNLEHPPLTKDLAALALVRDDIEPPPITRVATIPPIPALLEFFRANGVSLQEITARARMPFRWLFAALVVVVYVAARKMWSVGAAFLASAVIAFDPNFIAHAGVVHTDVAGSLFMTLTIVVALHARRSPARWLLVGLLIGLALLTKFTAAILVPLVLLAPLFFPGERRQAFAGALAACFVALVVILVGYAVNMRHMPAEDAARSAATFLRGRRCDPATVERYARLTLAAPQLGTFLTGVKGVQLTSNSDASWNYLRGEISRKGFPHYFFVAFLVKSTPAMLALTLVILAGGTLLRRPEALALLVPVVVLFVMAIPSSFNIGVRHILPVYPLLAITGAGILAARFQRFFRLAAALLVVSVLVSLRSSHPYELGYFNFIARGHGEAWLSDSNIDWAQDIERLQRLLRARGWDDDTRLVLFTSPVHWPELQEHMVEMGPLHGRYALSIYMEQMGPALITALEGPAAGAQMKKLVDALPKAKVLAKVGASITVYEIKAE